MPPPTSDTRRTLGLLPATAIVVSSMVGTGIFTTTGIMVSMGARSGDILVAWLVGGVVALCGALCYGEVGANFPESGGEYHYLSRLLHPSVGFIAGWVSMIVGFAAPTAAAAMAMHLYLESILPGWPVRTMAAATILLLSLLHGYDLRLGSRVQTTLIAIRLALVLLFAVMVLRTGSEGGDPVTFDPSFWTTSSFAVVLILVSFSYSGWNAAAYIGSDVLQPERNLFRSLLYGTVAVTGVYLLVNIAYVRSIPLDTLSGVEEVASVVATAVLGSTTGNLLSVLIALTLVAPISAMILTGPRVAEAMARDGFLPAPFGRLSRRKVPSIAVFFQAALASAIIMTSSFVTLLIYIGFTLSIFSGLTVIGLIRLRLAGGSRHRLCIGYPLPAVVYLVFTGAVTVWSIWSQPTSALAGGATVAVGYIAYLWNTRRQGGI